MRKMTSVMLVLIGLTVVLQSASANEAIIKYRQGHLAAMGGHTSAIFQLFGETNIPEEHLSLHAKSLVRLTNLLHADLDKLFPKGSGEGKTDALPKIWKDWDGFSEAADKAKSAADDVAAALEAEDKAAFGGAMKAMGGACKGCHKKYRKE